MRGLADAAGGGYAKETVPRTCRRSRGRASCPRRPGCSARAGSGRSPPPPSGAHPCSHFASRSSLSLGGYGPVAVLRPCSMQMHRKTKFVGEVARQRRSRPQGPARVRDDEHGAVVVLGLVERLHRRRRIRIHRHVRDVDVLVLHLHEAEVLLGLHLAGRRELRDYEASATLRLCRPAARTW